jgi:hypothetical protein
MDLTKQVQIILDEHPKLHVWGSGNPGRGKPSFEVSAARQELLDPSILLGIQTAASWCERHLVPTKPNMRRDGTTYYWKHVCERHTGGLYLPSGAFAVAAALAGLNMNWNSYNPVIYAKESREHPIEGRRG